MTKDESGADAPVPGEPVPGEPDSGLPDAPDPDGADPDGAGPETSGPEKSAAGGLVGSLARWFHRPVALGAVALVLAASGVSTIAYAVTRPDANHPPSVVGAQDVSGGIPVPVLPGAPTPAATARSASPTVPPALPAATVVPFYPGQTGSAGPVTGSASPAPTRTGAPSPSGSPTAPASRPAAPSGSPSSGSPSPAPTGKTLPTPLGSSDPVEVVVHALGIDRKPIRLGLTKDGALEVPNDAEDLGWYTGGPTPGAMGAAVIAGHVSYNKPGVFYSLATLRRGDTVEVRRRDGTTAVFTVSGTRVYPKDRFPTHDVYGFVDRAALRLITCGGDYDPKTRHFDDNVVVYADMTSVRG